MRQTRFDAAHLDTQVSDGAAQVRDLTAQAACQLKEQHAEGNTNADDRPLFLVRGYLLAS